MDNKVSIVNFRVPDGNVSGCKEHGARLKDQIILCCNNSKTDNNSRLVFSTIDIQDAVKAVHEAANNSKTRSKDKIIKMLLLRTKDEVNDAKVKSDDIEAAAADDDVIIRNLASWAMFGNADIKSYVINDMDPFLEPPNSISRLSSKVISMILKTRHPIILNESAMESTKQFIITIHDKIILQEKGNRHFMKQSNVPNVYGSLTLELISTLVNILIEFEGMLFTSGLAFNSTWNMQRKRLKWSQYMRNAKTLTAISLGISTLNESIQWANIIEACNPIPIDKYIANLNDDQKLKNIDLPAVNALMYYFSDGHIQALENDSKVTSKIPGASVNNKLWGGITPTPGKSMLCYVSGVKIFTIKTGKSSENVFAHVDLVQKTYHTPIEEVNKPMPNTKTNARMNRVFRRIINLLSLYPNSEPFARPVDTSLLPDYPSIVTNPMDLFTMIKKTNDNKYNSIEEFTIDINLIMSNCVLYCNERFPDIVKQVHVLHNEAMKLIEIFNNDANNNTNETIDNDDNDSASTTSSVSNDINKYPKSFTVALRINNDSVKFMVPKEAVVNSVYRFYHYYDLIRCDNNDGTSDEGFIVDSKKRLVGKNGIIDTVAWNWLKVEWYDRDSDVNTNTTRGQYINPWEIKLMFPFGIPRCD